MATVQEEGAEEGVSFQVSACPFDCFPQLTINAQEQDDRFEEQQLKRSHEVDLQDLDVCLLVVVVLADVVLHRPTLRRRSRLKLGSSPSHQHGCVRFGKEKDADDVHDHRKDEHDPKDGTPAKSRFTGESTDDGTWEREKTTTVGLVR
jgi:hypothetical protein